MKPVPRALIVIIVMLTAVGNGGVFAQQLPFYSQYTNNYFLLNPAIAGTTQNIDVRGAYRQQWMGFSGAPTTSALSFNSRLYKGMFGLGGFVVNDVIGPNQQTEYNFSGAYHIRFPDVELSLGAGGYLTQYVLNGSQMTTRYSMDPSLNNSMSSTWAENLGGGIYLYNDRFNIGFSGLNALQPSINVFTDSSRHGIVKFVTQANFVLGYNYSYNDNILYQNSFYANYTIGSPIVLDYTFRFHYKKKVFIGASLRWGDAIIASAGCTLMKDFQVSYSYDFLISNLMGYTSGSQEISLIYKLDLSSKKNRFLKQKYGYIL